MASPALDIPLDYWVRHQKLFAHDHGKPAGLPSPNPTRSFWTHSSPDANPLAREGSTGPLTADADICIIGSGMTGVGVAYHLSEAIGMLGAELSSPVKVVILEARDFCSGATGRNGGHLTPAAYSEFHALAAQYGPEEAKRSYALEAHTTSSLVRIIQEHEWTDDVDLVHGDHLDMLFSEEVAEDARRDQAAAVAAGWSLDGVVGLSKDEVKAMFGAHHPAIKFPGYNLWPLKLVTKLYQQAKTRSTHSRRFDLVLHTHTPVTAVEIIANMSSTVGSTTITTTNATARLYELSTPRGVIACSRVVHATNAYASHLLPFLAGRHGIVPVRGQVIATRASVDSDKIKLNSWCSRGHVKGLQYWFPRPVKAEDEQPLIILGGARKASYTAEEYIDDDTTCHPDVGKVLRSFLPAVFEGKFEQKREPEMEWTGIMAYTETGDPFVGPVDRFPAARGTEIERSAGQFIAAGQSGHGMPRAFGCAEVVAQMIMAELVCKEWKQPEWFPTRYLTWAEREATVYN